MKKVFKPILKYYLKYITKIVLFINSPTVIAVAGSTNKFFVKEEIKKTLSEQGIKFLVSKKSFNTEIGLPLSILSLPSGYNNYKKWLPAILRAPFSIIKTLPEVLVLELGVSDPGDMKHLLSIVKPNIVVVTDITQRYLEGFVDIEDLVGEYEYLMSKLRKNDLAIMNFDNSRIKKIKNATQATIESFGFNEDANWQATDVSRKKLGQSVKVTQDNIVKEYFMPKFGEHHVYSLLVGLIIKKYYAQ